jgi:hypothetical protein
MRPRDETERRGEPLGKAERVWRETDDVQAPEPPQDKPEGALRTFIRKLAMLYSLDPRGQSGR